MSGNGFRTATGVIIIKRVQGIIRKTPMTTIFACFAAVPGMANHGTRVRLPDSGTNHQVDLFFSDSAWPFNSAIYFLSSKIIFFYECYL